MGNRAVITTPKKDLALYLHWNGGRDTVEPLLTYCELQGYRPPSCDSYGWARMAQVMGNFFGGALSVGIDRFDRLGDQGDNGVYVIDGWKIVGRIEEELDDDYNVTGWHEFPESREQHEHDFDDMLRSFDEAMPKRLRLGAFLDSIEIPVSELKLGDTVWMREVDGTIRTYPVIGFGTDMVNGADRTGCAYVARYGRNGDYSLNPNNYPHGKTCRIAPRK
ncbi:hypothetical protein [Adlercreutzia sp. ZJ141]|uniref:hypothetical protein n=1 Tax=Adlercreutzia sp. ZJ141 TaxID=2709406 RepID=UPI0013EAD4F0|nr:hypothetical protein [Adlercreutzia sp. ZJ141]